MQRRPTESAYEPSSTQRQITSNYAGSYDPATTRPTTVRTTAQEQQYSESYNNKPNFNNYQSPKQFSSTQTPPDFGKISVSTYNQADYRKTEQSTTQKINSVFNQRQPSTPDYKPYSESTLNYNNKKSTYNNEALNKNPVSITETRNYNADNANINRTSPQPVRRVISRQRGQQTYRNQQTSNGNYNSETSPQSYDTSSSSVKYNANQNNNNNNRNSQPTQRYLNNDQSSVNQYDNTNRNANNQETTYQIKYSSPSTTQQTTAKYNNDYNHKQISQYNNNYNNEDTQDFGKIKSSPKYEEKKIAFSSTKSPVKGNDFENQFNNNPQTPAPKFNTNLLYDNNQQSTPDYYKTDYNNQDSKTSNSPASTKSQQFASASGSDFYKNQPKSQYSTPQPFSYNQGVSQSSEPKSKTNVQTYPTSQPSPFVQGASHSQKSYEQRYTADVKKTSTSQPSSFAPRNSQNHRLNNEPSTAYVQKISTAQPSSFPSQATSFNQQSQQQKLTANVQQYSTAQPSSFNQGTNYNQKPTSNVQQYSTAQPTNYNQGASSQNSYEQKSTQNVQQYQPTTGRSTPQYNQRSEAKYQVSSYKESKPQDYDDGQYRPEVHERESGGEYDVTVRQPTRKEEIYDAQQEGEFLKTAHSINIAASGNQLARDRARAQISGPSSTKTAVYQQSQVTTQLPPRRIQTTVAPRSASSILPVSITSTQPRPFSIRVPDTPAPQSKKFVESKTSSSSPAKPLISPETKPASSPQAKPAPSPQAKQAHLSSRPAQQSQPTASQKAKDVSYDYAYYDNSDHSDHYSEYENIEEFGRTSKRQ